MKHNILAPLIGESITEVSILKWNKKNGEAVKAGEQILEIESDKATVEIVAEKSGVLNILKQAGERVQVKSVIGTIDDSATATAGETAPPPPPAPSAVAKPSMPTPPPTEGLSPAVRK